MAFRLIRKIVRNFLNKPVRIVPFIYICFWIENQFYLEKTNNHLINLPLRFRVFYSELQIAKIHMI